MTCGNSSSSRSACPWIVRSGQNASRALPQRRTSSGSTIARVAPIGTVERTTTSVLGGHVSATARAASRRCSSCGAWVTGSTGVDTQITAASTGSCGSVATTRSRVPRCSRNASSTPGS